MNYRHREHNEVKRGNPENARSARMANAKSLYWVAASLRSSQ
jgi:hypothetical protein